MESVVDLVNSWSLSPPAEMTVCGSWVLDVPLSLPAFSVCCSVLSMSATAQ